MASLFMGNALWQLVAISDWISKGVLLVLLGMSIACWTVFFYKVILFRLKKRQLMQALIAIKQVRSVPDLVALTTQLVPTMPGHFLTHNMAFLKSIAQQHEQHKSPLSELDWEGIGQQAEQTFEDMVHHEEGYLPILYASASVAPLLGLFGTVWGLIHSFIRIGEKQSADIAAVAPGIAEALITTLAGIVVAVPAYLMYHYLSVQVRHIEHNLSLFVDHYLWTVKQLFKERPQ